MYGSDEHIINTIQYNIQYQHNNNTANNTVHWLYSANTITIQQTLQYIDYTVPTQSQYSKHYSTLIIQYQHNQNKGKSSPLQWLHSWISHNC